MNQLDGGNLMIKNYLHLNIKIMMVQSLLLISVAVNDKASDLGKEQQITRLNFICPRERLLENHEKIVSFEKVWISCSQPRTYNKIEDFTNIEDSSPKFGTNLVWRDLVIMTSLGWQEGRGRNIINPSTVIKGGKNWPVNLEKIFENITIHQYIITPYDKTRVL
ncbi:hypothetical protein RIR_jg11267.t1 [Rhizophagus irregularis DAOM 181602=DAOM 197198]|nr:hypothetical protein RIR_jg11267.t1 [Rhizophagus irregularis DAOM 181602=DAOM 197198]